MADYGAMRQEQDRFLSERLAQQNAAKEAYMAQAAADAAARQQLLESSYGGMRQRAQQDYDQGGAFRQQQYDRGVEQMNRATAKAQQEAYLSHAMQQRDMAQRLKAAGSTGGMSETAMLGLQNIYGSQRGLNERQRMDNLFRLQGDHMARQEDARRALAQALLGFDQSRLQQDLQGRDAAGARQFQHQQDHNRLLQEAQKDRQAGYLQIGNMQNSYDTALMEQNEQNARQAAANAHAMEMLRMQLAPRRWR